MRTAVCTIVIGNRFERLFRDYVFTSWQAYCRSHGYELPLRNSIVSSNSPDAACIFIVRSSTGANRTLPVLLCSPGGTSRDAAFLVQLSQFRSF
jgi:hypothetical protein